MFKKFNEDGSYRRKRVQIDCQKAIENGEKPIVEQSHKRETEINAIIKTHGISRLMLTQQAKDLVFDNVTTNDFQEAMNLIKKGADVFAQLSSVERAEFNNSPEQYLDYVHNPANKDNLIERGWMKPPEPEPEPIKVQITNSETPAAETAAE